LKNRKSPYLSNGFNNHREIWHGDAFWPGLASYHWAVLFAGASPIFSREEFPSISYT